jgi:hypothetical protein
MDARARRKQLFARPSGWYQRRKVLSSFPWSFIAESVEDEKHAWRLRARQFLNDTQVEAECQRVLHRALLDSAATRALRSSAPG